MRQWLRSADKRTDFRLLSRALKIFFAQKSSTISQRSSVARYSCCISNLRLYLCFVFACCTKLGSDIHTVPHLDTMGAPASGGGRTMHRHASRGKRTLLLRFAHAARTQTKFSPARKLLEVKNDNVKVKKRINECVYNYRNGSSSRLMKM